jgi:hypothetical protein
MYIVHGMMRNKPVSHIPIHGGVPWEYPLPKTAKRAAIDMNGITPHSRISLHPLSLGAISLRTIIVQHLRDACYKPSHCASLWLLAQCSNKQNNPSPCPDPVRNTTTPSTCSSAAAPLTFIACTAAHFLRSSTFDPYPMPAVHTCIMSPPPATLPPECPASQPSTWQLTMPHSPTHYL